MEVYEMDKIERFENLLEKYLRYSQVNYFVGSYERIYKYLHEHEGRDYEYHVDYGRLWGMYEMLQYEMEEEDRKEVLHMLCIV